MSDKVTIYTLAERLNLSASAVSRAFNPNSKLSAEKRKIILAAAEQYGYVPNKMASRLSQNPIRIGVLMRGRIYAYYSNMVDGINAAYREFQNYKVTCDLRAFTPKEFSSDAACRVLDDFLEQHYDGVIVHGLYNKDFVDRVNQLTDAGTVVVTLHNDLPVSKRLFTVTIDVDTVARMVAQLFDILLPPDKRHILSFSGSMQSTIHQGLILNLSKFAGAQHLQLLQNYDTLDLPEYAETLIEDAFRSHDDVHGIYISSANSIPICRYIDSHGLAGKIPIIASDVFDELNEYINRGVVTATIFQDPYAQGYNAFAKLYYHIAEGLQVPSVVTTKPQIVLKSNLHLY